MKWDDGIQGKTLNIAGTLNNPLRVMAGPGTGKTFAMERRVARLLQEGNNPERILAVTFSRTAAADLLKKLRNIGVDGCEKIKACTLHSYCLETLMKGDVLRYTGRHPRGLMGSGSKFEYAPLVEDLRMANFGNKTDCKKTIKAFEGAWAKLQSDEPGWPSDPRERAFHDYLKNWLTFHKGILIGELVPLTLDYIKNNPHAECFTLYDHIIVDEYQDLNKAEQVLLNILSKNLQYSIVGDEDQSIFSFRFAHPDGIKEFNVDYPMVHDESLDECRRCATKIVGLANNLILYNHPASTPARLNAFASNSEGEVSIIQWKNLGEEITGISKYVHNLISTGKYLPGDFLILSPRKLIGYGIRSELKTKDIPVHCFYDDEALESVEAQEAFCLLTLLTNKDDLIALRFWLGLGKKTWSAGEYKKLRLESTKSRLSVFEVLDQIRKGHLTLKGVNNICNRFNILQEYLTELGPLSILNLIDKLFPEAKDEVKTFREASLLKWDTLSDNDKELFNVYKLYQYLKTLVTQPEMPSEGEFVRIMSLHKSKGLTSKIVIVASCVEGLVPFRDVKASPNHQENTLAEQRRLFYVAITRGKEILVLSSFKEIERKEAFGLFATLGKGGTKEIGNTVASRFFNELGSEAPTALKGDEWLKKSQQ